MEITESSKAAKPQHKIAELLVRGNSLGFRFEGHLPEGKGTSGSPPESSRGKPVTRLGARPLPAEAVREPEDGGWRPLLSQGLGGRLGDPRPDTHP